MHEYKFQSFPFNYLPKETYTYASKSKYSVAILTLVVDFDNLNMDFLIWFSHLPPKKDHLNHHNQKELILKNK